MANKACPPQRPLDVRYSRATASIGVGPEGPIGPPGPLYASGPEIEVSDATPVIDFSAGEFYLLNLSANATPTIIPPATVGWYQVRAKQDSTPRTITWPVNVLGSPPQPSTGPDDNTFYPLYWDLTNWHYVAGGGSSVTAGNGILDTAGTWSVKPDGGTIGVSASGVKVADASIGTTQLANDGVTYAKIQNISAPSRALGRGSAAGAGDAQELAFTGGISVVGTDITIVDGALSWAKLNPAAGNFVISGMGFIGYTAEFDNGDSTSAKTITFVNGLHQKVTHTANCAFTIVAPAGACTMQLKLIVGPGGPYTKTWPANMIWPGGGEPVWSTVAGDYDIVTIYSDGTNLHGTSVPSTLQTAGTVLVHAATLSSSRKVLSLLGAVTDAEMPADTGDGVLRIEDCAAEPGAGVPSGGHTVWGTTTVGNVLRNRTGLHARGPLGGDWAVAHNSEWRHFIYSGHVETSSTATTTVLSIDPFTWGANLSGIIELFVTCQDTIGQPAVKYTMNFRRQSGTITVGSPTIDGGAAFGTLTVNTISSANIDFQIDAPDGVNYRWDMMAKVTFNNITNAAP